MTLFFEPFAPMLSTRTGALRTFSPPADVAVSPEHVSVVMDVPGFKPDELEIELVDNVLTVKGERALPHGYTAQGSREWRRVERGFGKFERSLRMPRGLDPDAINASLSDGVLTLLIPMPEARKPHRIQVMAGGTQPVLEDTTESPAEERELAGATA